MAKKRGKSNGRLSGTGPGAIERLVHDLPDGPGASPALGAATKTTINLAGRARVRLRLRRGADIVVAQNVARANDHGMVPGRTTDTSAPGREQKKSAEIIRCLNCKSPDFTGFASPPDL